ncbi:MAG: hypothetical protein NVS3B28_28030 [Candidatus Velthaea sp.]
MPAAGLYAVIFLASVTLAYARPIGALVLLAASAPFALTRYVGHTTLTTFKVALVGTLVGLAPALLHALRQSRVWPRVFIVSLAALLCATAATIAVAAYPSVALRETFKVAEYALVALVAFAIASSTRDDRFFSASVAAIVVLVVLDALRDFVHPQSGFYVGEFAVVRLAGHLEGPNQLAAFIGIALPVLALSTARERGWAFALVLALAAFGLVATFSRTGISLGLIAAAAALWGQRWGRPAIALFVGSLGALTVFFFLFNPRSVLHVVSSAQETAAHAGGVGTRNDLWAAARRMWRSHPFLGVGAGNYEYLLPQYGAPAGVRTHANSLYLEALADGGIVLAIATVIAAWLPPLRMLVADPFVRAIGIAGIALALHGISDDVTFYTKVGEWWWLFAGYGMGCAMRAVSAPSVAPGIRYPRT